MIDSLLYDGLLFDSPDFHVEALEFFSIIGHASAETPSIVAEDILQCIYSELKFNSFFDKSERSAFSCIESLSLLFSLDDDVFYRQQCPQIRYFAISINTYTKNRTIVANIITNAFAKNTSDYVVILFRHENMCMLSFAKKNSGFITLFSDWFDKSDFYSITQKIDIGNLSLHNSKEFFSDFVFLAAREYYIEPVSRDYALTEWYYMNPLSIEDDSLPKWNEHIEESLNAHIIQYGDDYIDIPTIADNQAINIDDNDFDFDLLELELDEMLAADAFEMENNDFDNIDDYLDSNEDINIANIPPDIMDDPVKLLEWLNQQEDKQNTDERW